MKKRISLFATLAMLCALALSSCLVVPEGPEGPSGGDSYSIIRSAEGGNNMMEVRSAIYESTGSMYNVLDDSYPEEGREIVMGSTTRNATSRAKSIFESKGDSFSDPAGVVICEYNGSIAVWWSDPYIESYAINLFINEYVKKGNLSLDANYTYTDIFSLSEHMKADEEVIREGYYAAIAEGLGEDAANALRGFYSLYDERLYLWEAGLYDPGVGGYYYSNSALANEGYLPDLESTVQALRFIAQSGMMNNYGGSVDDLHKVFTPEMIEGFVRFAHSCQSPDDGYYYHPQWGTGVGDLRLGRDLGWGVALLDMFDQIPLYNTPGGHKGSLGDPGASATSLTAPLAAGSSVSAVSKVVPVAAVADRFSTEEKFEAYFNSFNWADPTVGSHEGSSYHAGGTLAGQTSQIKAAGMGPKCIELFDAMQERVQESLRAEGLPVNGLWDPHNSYDAVNGVMKITSIYQSLDAKINYSEEMMECVIEMIVNTQPDFDGATPTGAITVYNPWVSASAVLSNMNSHGSAEEAAAIRDLIRDNAAEMIRITAQKLSIFERDNGVYGIYATGKAPANQYGAPIAVKDTVEGDINGANICSTGTLRTMSSTLGISEFIGLPILPIYYESDLRAYLKVMLNASPVIKNEIVLVNDPVTFDDDAVGTEDSDISGINISANGGKFTVVSDPTDPDNNVLQLVTVNHSDGGDSVTVNTANQKDTTSCYGFEWRMYVDEIRSSTKIPFQMKLGECFMLSFKNEGDSLGLYAASGTSSGYIEEKLGVSTKNGEWHTYRIEYYKLDDGAHAKIFVDGNLRADTTVYYGQHGGKEPSNSYGYGRLFATKTCDLTVLYDDIVVEKLDKPYVEETLASPDRIKDFEGLDGELYDGIKIGEGLTASVVEDPFESDNALKLSGGGTMTLVTTAESAESNCYVLDTKICVESGSGEVGRILMAENSSVPVVGYVLISDGDYVTVHELSKNGANVDVLGEEVGDFAVGEWTNIRIEYYRYQRKAIVKVGEYSTVSEAYYREANLGAAYMQLDYVLGGGVTYLDDVLAERTSKVYVEGGVEIPDTDTTFPEGQQSTSTAKPKDFDGSFDFENQQIGDSAVPGADIAPNGEVGNSVTVEADPEDSSNKVLSFNTEYSASNGNSVRFQAHNTGGSIYVIEFDIYFESVGNAAGTQIDEFSIRANSSSVTGKTIFGFAFKYNGADGISLAAKKDSKKVLASGLEMEQWHKIRVEYDCASGVARVSVNGGEAVASSAYESEENRSLALGFMSFLANQRTNEIIHLDNVKVYTE